MELSIIIVTYNNEREIGRCLRSVFAHSEGLETEVFVIDNASSDKTREILANTKDIKVILNNKNLGFAAAVNQGIEKSFGDNILLLNPDTELQLGSLSAMVKYLHDRPEVGIAGGKALNRDGSIQPSVRRFPTLGDQLVIYSKLYRFFPKLVSKYLCAGFDYAKEQEVDQVRGACFFVTRDLLNKIGPLDAKSFFIWFEEVDYCRRAKDAGFKVMYVPSSIVVHDGGASFGQMKSLKKQLWLNRSMRNYFRKHGTAFDVLMVVLLAPVSLLLAAGVQAFKIKPKKYV